MYDNKPIRDTVIKAVSDHANIPMSELRSDCEFENIACDELDVVEIIMNIEDELNITLVEEPEFQTIGDLIQYVEASA